MNGNCLFHSKWLVLGYTVEIGLLFQIKKKVNCERLKIGKKTRIIWNKILTCTCDKTKSDFFYPQKGKFR